MQDEFQLRKKSSDNIWIRRRDRLVKQPDMNVRRNLRAVEVRNTKRVDMDELATAFDRHPKTVKRANHNRIETSMINILGFKNMLPALTMKKTRAVVLYLLGYSQKEVAARCEVSQPTISRWLRDAWAAAAKNSVHKK